MAIASDAQGVVTLSNPATTITFNVTTSGSDILMYFGWVHSSATVTDVTYNAVSATQIDSGTAVSSQTLRNYYLLNAASGTNEVKFELASSVQQFGGANSYTGVDSLDASIVNDQTTETTTTTTLTTIADNCWTMMTCRTVSSGTSSAGTGTTQRSNGAGLIQMYDSNAAITPAGSTSLQTTQSSQGTAHVMASFAPATGGAPAFIPKVMIY